MSSVSPYNLGVELYTDEPALAAELSDLTEDEEITFEFFDIPVTDPIESEDDSGSTLPVSDCGDIVAFVGPGTFEVDHLCDKRYFPVIVVDSVNHIMQGGIIVKYPSNSKFIVTVSDTISGYITY